MPSMTAEDFTWLCERLDAKAPKGWCWNVYEPSRDVDYVAKDGTRERQCTSRHLAVFLPRDNGGEGLLAVIGRCITGYDEHGCGYIESFLGRGWRQRMLDAVLAEIERVGATL